MLSESNLFYCASDIKQGLIIGLKISILFEHDFSPKFVVNYTVDIQKPTCSKSSCSGVWILDTKSRNFFNKTV